MTQHVDTAEALRRYAAMVEELLPAEPAGFEADFGELSRAEVEGPGFVQVERGGALGLAAKGWHESAGAWLERVLRMGMDAGGNVGVADAVGRTQGSPLQGATVIDRKAHYRPLYRGMLLHGAIGAFGLGYELIPREAFGMWEEGLRAWCETLEPTIAEADVADATRVASAARGAAIAEAAWGGLVLHEAGKLFVRDAWTDLASHFFGRLTRGQLETGQYLRAGAGDNIETATYHELAILHAAAGYAVRAEDRHVAKGVKKSTEFHLENTQPDHATNQPFGLFAFIWNEKTRSVADGMLHALRTMGRTDGVTGILLGDTLVSLRLFL